LRKIIKELQQKNVSLTNWVEKLRVGIKTKAEMKNLKMEV